MAAALGASSGEVVAFLDADVANTTPAFVTGLLGPLLTTDDVALVKGFYTRPLHDDPTGGGRVTELVARPVLELLFPELSDVRQPLAGETAAHRWVFEKVGFADGYGVELGLLIDVAQALGADRLAQVDLGERIHRNRPLHELRPQAVDVMRAALAAGARLVAAARAREPHHRRLQPRAAHVPHRAPTARSSRSRPVAGWPRRCTGSWPGRGTTWASVTMGAADREAVAQGLMHLDGLDLVPVVVDDDTYRQAYDVVANTTLWYVHHHLFDLPNRPRFDRHWRAAWEGYRAYNRAMADAVSGAGRRRRHRAGAGLPLLVARADAGRAPARPAHRALLAHALRRRRRCWPCCPTTWPPSCSTAWPGYGACGFHCHKWEAGVPRLLRRGRPGRPAHVRRAARARRRRAGRGGGVARMRGGGGRVDGRARVVAAWWPGRTAWSPRRTSCAGCSPSRSC